MENKTEVSDLKDSFRAAVRTWIDAADKSFEEFCHMQGGGRKLGDLKALVLSFLLEIFRDKKFSPGASYVHLHGQIYNNSQ